MGVSQECLTRRLLVQGPDNKGKFRVFWKRSRITTVSHHSWLVPSCKDTIKMMLYSRNFSLLTKDKVFLQRLVCVKILWFGERKKKNLLFSETHSTNIVRVGALTRSSVPSLCLSTGSSEACLMGRLWVSWAETLSLTSALVACSKYFLNFYWQVECCK